MTTVSLLIQIELFGLSFVLTRVNLFVLDFCILCFMPHLCVLHSIRCGLLLAYSCNVDVFNRFLVSFGGNSGTIPPKF